MDSEFEIGDLVELKSGGPVMTIGRIHVGEAVCFWFGYSESYSTFGLSGPGSFGDSPYEYTFNLKALKKYEPVTSQT